MGSSGILDNPPNLARNQDVADEIPAAMAFGLVFERTIPSIPLKSCESLPMSVEINSRSRQQSRGPKLVGFGPYQSESESPDSVNEF